jgi:hypothetical protein
LAHEQGRACSGRAATAGLGLAIEAISTVLVFEPARGLGFLQWNNDNGAPRNKSAVPRGGYATLRVLLLLLLLLLLLEEANAELS